MKENLKQYSVLIRAAVEENDFTRQWYFGTRPSLYRDMKDELECYVEELISLAADKLSRRKFTEFFRDEFDQGKETWEEFSSTEWTVSDIRNRVQRQMDFFFAEVYKEGVLFAESGWYKDILWLNNYLPNGWGIWIELEGYQKEFCQKFLRLESKLPVHLKRMGFQQSSKLWLSRLERLCLKEDVDWESQETTIRLCELLDEFYGRDGFYGGVKKVEE